MLLSARLLTDVASVNNFRTVNQISFRAGSTADIYLQLLDRDQDRDFNPPGRRYIPASKSTLVASVRSAYPRKQLAFAARQSFPQDLSIWHFRIDANDGKFAPAPGNGPIIDYSNLIPLGMPFDFNSVITDYGLSGTFALSLTLIENQGYTMTATLAGIVAGDSIELNSIVFLAVPSGATGTQFNIGASDTQTASNLAAVINTYSPVAQVTALSASNVLAITAVGVATITATASPSFALTTPILTPDAKLTTGWVEAALSIQPGFPAI